MALDRQSFLARPRKRKAVDLDGEQAWIKQVSLSQQKALRDFGKAKPKDVDQDDYEQDLTMRLLVMSLCDENGVQLFQNDDIPAMCDSFAIDTLAAIAEEAMVLNGMKKPEPEDEKKRLPNLPPTTTPVSPINSVSP